MGIAQFAAGQKLTASQLNSLPVVVSYLSTGSVSNSAAETVIGTFTIPAGDATFPGGYQFFVHGTGSITGTPTLTVRMRLNGIAGTLLVTGTGTATIPTNIFQFQGWLGMEALGSPGSFGQQISVVLTYTGTASQAFGVLDAVAMNTTVSNTLVITAQYSAASPSNTATTKFGALYRL